jgi:LruC domain-containing protein
MTEDKTRAYVKSRNTFIMNVRMIKCVLLLFVILVFLGFVVSGCSSRLDSTGSEGTTLPPDIINFVTRTTNGNFKFDTVRPTCLNFKLVPCSGNKTVNESFASKSQLKTDDLIFATIRNEDGEVIYGNGVPAGGTLSAELVMPSEPQDFTMTLSSPRYNERILSFENLNQYQELTGTIFIEKAQASEFLVSIGDEDDDGVPDVYDAFPNNPLFAFSEIIPAVNMLTIAFEDNYPQLGDGDYNDFVATYFMEDLWSDDGMLRIIVGRVQALARAASYNHRFGMVMDFENYHGVVLIKNFDEQGNITHTESACVKHRADMTLFQETKTSFTRPTPDVTIDNGYPDLLDSKGHCAQFAFMLLWAGEGNPPTGGWGKIGWDVHDPYLYVHDTGCDVHLIGKPPLPDSQNPNAPDGFLDANGFPRALLVPSDWGYPIELTHIETAYDDFDDWRTTEGTDFNSWYLNPNEEHVIPIQLKLPKIVITQELIDELMSLLAEHYPLGFDFFVL